MGVPFSCVCGIRCKQCSPLFWRLQNSVPERASYGTEYACRAKKGVLRYATRFLKPSVLKTGFWGTEGIFGTGNALLRYAMHPKRRETADSDTRPLNLSNKTISQCASASEIWSKLLKIFVIDRVYHTHQQLSLITVIGYSHSMVEYACGSISYPSIP